MFGWPVAGRWGSADDVAHFLGSNPSIAVPRCASTIKTNAVHHTVTREPVVFGFVDIAGGVRPITEISTSELSGNRARHAQIGDGDLFMNWRQVAGKKRVGRGAFDGGHDGLVTYER
jgi:hypothetical protein